MSTLRYPPVVNGRVEVVVALPSSSCLDIDTTATTEDGPSRGSTTAASLHIQCDIIRAHESRVELVSCGCGGRTGAIGCEDDVVRGRLRGTLAQQNRSSSGSSGDHSSGIGACGQATSCYVMGELLLLLLMVVVIVGDQDHVREVEIAMLRLLRRLLQLDLLLLLLWVVVVR